MFCLPKKINLHHFRVGSGFTSHPDFPLHSIVLEFFQRLHSLSN